MKWGPCLTSWMKTLAVGTRRAQWAPGRWGPCLVSTVWGTPTVRTTGGLTKYPWLRGVQIQPDWSRPVLSRAMLLSWVSVGKPRIVVRSTGFRTKQPGFKSQVTELLCEPTIDVSLIFLHLPHPSGESLSLFWHPRTSQRDQGKRIIWGPKPQRRAPPLKARILVTKNKPSGTELRWCVCGLFYFIKRKEIWEWS